MISLCEMHKKPQEGCNCQECARSILSGKTCPTRVVTKIVYLHTVIHTFVVKAQYRRVGITKLIITDWTLLNYLHAQCT